MKEEKIFGSFFFLFVFCLKQDFDDNDNGSIFGEVAMDPFHYV